MALGLALFLGLPAQLEAQGIVADATSSKSAGASAVNSISWSHTVTGNHTLLIVGVSINLVTSNPTVGSVTYNGTNLTFVGAATNASSARIEIWRLIAPATGTNTIVVTLASSATGLFVAGAASFTEVDQTTPLGTFFSNTNASTTVTPTVDVTGVNDGEVVIDTIANKNLSTGAALPIPTSPQVQQWCDRTTSGTANNNTPGCGSINFPPAGGGTVTMSWTISSARLWAIGAVAIKPYSVTAVRLIAFTAKRSERGTQLQWRTGYEVDNLGFNVYREQNGQRVRITSSLVPGMALIGIGRGASAGGGTYSWSDATVPPEAEPVRYWLEDVDLHGQSTWHGPIVPAPEPPRSPKGR